MRRRREAEFYQDGRPNARTATSAPIQHTADSHWSAFLAGDVGPVFPVVGYFEFSSPLPFFRELEIPEPDVNLGVGSGTQTTQTAEIMRRLDATFAERKPDLVLVVGDVNSTMAAALVAAKLWIPVGHVEAGLRSFERRMPEEINRLVTDTLSDYLFVSEPSGLLNLRAEGVFEDRIFLVGNVMIDTLLRFRQRAALSGVLDRFGLKPESYM